MKAAEKSAFASLHPFVQLLYFLFLFLAPLLTMHPGILILTAVGGVAYSLYLNAAKVLKNFLFLFPAALLLGAVNPIFNHSGITILLYINNTPVTLESILYGAASGLMFLSLFLWFFSWNRVMDSDRLLFLTGKHFPSLGLLFTMTLRLIPRYNRESGKIARAQKGIGRSVKDGTFLQRIKNGGNILSSLTAWALENGVDTADSMRARGYGLPGRSRGIRYRFSDRDVFFLCLWILSIAVFAVAAAYGGISAQFFPALRIVSSGCMFALAMIAVGVISFIPVVFDIVEDIRWIYLRSKI